MKNNKKKIYCGVCWCVTKGMVKWRLEKKSNKVYLTRQIPQFWIALVERKRDMEKFFFAILDFFCHLWKIKKIVLEFFFHVSLFSGVWAFYFTRASKVSIWWWRIYGKSLNITWGAFTICVLLSLSLPQQPSNATLRVSVALIIKKNYAMGKLQKCYEIVTIARFFFYIFTLPQNCVW